MLAGCFLCVSCHVALPLLPLPAYSRLTCLLTRVWCCWTLGSQGQTQTMVSRVGTGRQQLQEQ